jgi:hypothetical protein
VCCASSAWLSTAVITAQGAVIVLCAVSLFGSDIEKNVKKAAADGEPQWDDAGLKVGLQCWRIEKFKVVKWSKPGKFHRGDSCIAAMAHTLDADMLHVRVV